MKTFHGDFHPQMLQTRLEEAERGDFLNSLKRFCEEGSGTPFQVPA